jgi:hypothetical protein
LIQSYITETERSKADTKTVQYIKLYDFTKSIEGAFRGINAKQIFKNDDFQLGSILLVKGYK